MSDNESLGLVKALSLQILDLREQLTALSMILLGKETISHEDYLSACEVAEEQFSEIRVRLEGLDPQDVSRFLELLKEIEGKSL